MKFGSLPSISVYLQIRNPENEVEIKEELRKHIEPIKTVIKEGFKDPAGNLFKFEGTRVGHVYKNQFQMEFSVRRFLIRSTRIEDTIERIEYYFKHSTDVDRNIVDVTECSMGISLL